MKHRLLYVTSSLADGGQQRQLWYLLRGLDRQRYSPAVAVLNCKSSSFYGARLRELTVPTYTVETMFGPVGRIAGLSRLVRELQPEVVHAHAFSTNFPAWIGTRSHRVVVVGSVRSDYWRSRDDIGTMRWNLCTRYPGTLITNSAKAHEAATTHSGWGSPKKVHYVPNAIDFSLFRCTAPEFEEQFQIVGIGRLSAEKNWNALLDILRGFGRVVNRPWRFRLFGEGPLRPKLESRIAELGLFNNVELRGFTNDVLQAISSSHVVVLPSRYEGSPNAVLEAMACSRPVIATDVGDVSKIVRHGVDGFVVPITSLAQIQNHLLLLSRQPNTAIEMGSNAAERVRSGHSVAQVVSDTLEVYRECGWRDR